MTDRAKIRQHREDFPMTMAQMAWALTQAGYPIGDSSYRAFESRHPSGPMPNRHLISVITEVLKISRSEIVTAHDYRTMPEIPKRYSTRHAPPTRAPADAIRDLLRLHSRTMHMSPSESVCTECMQNYPCTTVEILWDAFKTPKP